MKYSPMTKAQIFELFLLMRSEWENAPMFKAASPEELRSKLELKAALWEVALKEENIDYWLGKLAFIRLLKFCKFPPTLAEFIEAAQAERKAEESEIAEAFFSVVNAYKVAECFGVQDSNNILKALSARPKRVIEALGGWSAFYNPESRTFNSALFNETYDRLLRSNPLPIDTNRALQIGDNNG